MRRQKVFCIGLGKTGTTSLKEALRLLDYRLIRLPINWKGITDFDAALPGVSAAMFPELDAEYPKSKFILTVRDVDSWLKSIERDMGLKQGMSREHQAEREKILTLKYGRSTFDETAFRTAFHEHENKVKHYFKDRPDDLLVLNVTTNAGWAPLCSFLGVPVPDVPFPYVNKAVELDALLARLLYVTQDIDVVSKISKYSPESIRNLYAKYDLANYDLDAPLDLKDDRRINKVLKRSCAYFGTPSKTAKALNIPIASVKEGLASQRHHARRKLRPRHPLARIRQFINASLRGKKVE